MSDLTFEAPQDGSAKSCFLFGLSGNGTILTLKPSNIQLLAEKTLYLSIYLSVEVCLPLNHHPHPHPLLPPLQCLHQTHPPPLHQHQGLLGASSPKKTNASY